MNSSYKDKMFDGISKYIEETGSHDEHYTNEAKARDILEVLEALLAYTIYTTCVSKETVRDSCEESYFNIKRQALALMEKELQETKNNG
ncbi:Uncharacterised protein [Legionella beliardensis]|uniref:Uncharacterized protein n=1 Tax=Legionella beliardensis TaxID=91822 RepID=A0A378HY08_9GAMM|nr:hypothetical protein [Legionella beliardensis]STX27778.1 Uncharacterised protein [Legionella beliardensis]